MKKITLTFFALLVTLSTWQVNAQTVTGSNLAVFAIPDNAPGITMPVNITGIPSGATLTDIEIDLAINHTWAGDLIITLAAPTGETSTVLFKPGTTTGGAGDSSNLISTSAITFTDVSSNSAEDMGSTIPGGQFICQDDAICDYFPTLEDGSLSLFAVFVASLDPMNDANGDWSVYVEDTAGGDTGDFIVPELRITYSAGAPPIAGCATDTPIVITTVGGVTYNSILNIADSGILGTDYDLDLTSIEIPHTWTSDLDIQLQSPMGTILDLSMGNGGSGDNYTATVFQDGGADINAASPPFTGTFEPEGGTFAAAFGGEDLNGDWTLIVTDNFGGDGGSIDSFCIGFLPISGPIGDPPVIACPADISVDTDPGVCEAVVNFA
ncbi:MAG: proprotein convertase P-domain-containing protein, partial [Flavobacteriaceae bacterium]|nr:proprotein convertase P-domain-containing protein [Flavobacteriaceae bacterium]